MNRVKMLLLVLLFSISFQTVLQAQKKQLDTSAISKWRYIDDGHISDDGHWISYSIVEGDDQNAEIVIRSVTGTKEFRCKGRMTQFSADSRFAVFMQGTNELHMLKLGQNSSEKIAEGNSFELVGTDRNYVLYEPLSAIGQLKIKDLSSGKQLSYSNVKSHLLLNEALLITESRIRGQYDLRKIDLKSGNEKLIWSGSSSPENLVSSKDFSKLVFITGTKIWYGDFNKDAPVNELLLSLYKDLEGLTFNGIVGFSTNNNSLILSYRGPATPSINKDANPVQIFSYQESAINTDLFNSEGAKFQPASYQVMYDISTGRMIRLNQSETFAQQSTKGDLVVVYKDSWGSDYYWNKKQVQGRLGYIKNISIGFQVGKDFECNSNEKFSNDGRYLVYEQPNGDIYSIDIASEKTTNLTQQLSIPSVESAEVLGGNRGVIKKIRGITFAGWASFANDHNHVVIYDRYDIWLLDVSGKDQPVCLTGGFGRVNHIVFRLIDASLSSLNLGERVYLKAFNEDTKDAGFFQLNWTNLSSPVKLSMGRYIYADVRVGQYADLPLGRPIKRAKNLNRWLVSRQSAIESPNLFWTNDFKDFYAVSDVHPEKEYNWFTTELINYTTKDGVKSQAILYRPDNLDTTKKYPVLFNFYENETFKLNFFQRPEYTNQLYFSIPMMLAQGYLVCVPDIHFKLGETAHSFVDCIEGAAEAISRISYIDSAHFGASGGSFGGYGTNCLAAFSHRFKALVPISGMSDMITNYGDIVGIGAECVENRQHRMGVSLSRDPERYLRNSPVAYAKDVTTPILIVNTLLDYNVNVQQGIEWFISLRREGKEAWMLRYQSRGHGVPDLDRKDLYIRMNQFFDHYLKGASTPKWMMDSLPIWERSGEEGFKLMPAGIEPGLGLNTEEDIQRRNQYHTKNK